MTSAPQNLPPFSGARVLILLLATVASLCELFIEGNTQSDWARNVFTTLAVVFFAGFILMSIRLFWTPAPGESISSFRAVVLTIGSVVFWSIAVGMAIFAVGWLVSLVEPAAGPLLIYALAFTTLILVAISSAGQIIRRRRMLLILSHLEKASQLNLPMSRMILAAAQGENGTLRSRLMALHDRLDAGEPLDQALTHSVPEIPDHIVRAIAAGQRMGGLPHVLDGLIRHRANQNGPLVQTLGVYRAYPLIFLAVLLLILVVVIPKFQGIFHDFKLDLPQPTILLLQLSPESLAWWIILILAALVPLGWITQRLIPSSRSYLPWGAELGDQIICWLPIAGSYTRDRGMADLCDLASVGVEMGHPLDQTLRDVAGAQPNAVMRHRVTAWADAVSRGQPIHEAARSARLPDLFVAMLATVRDSAGLLQVLSFLWRHYEYRFLRTRTFLQAAYVPIVVFLMGAMVALLGTSLLKPMAMLNEHLALHISGGF